MSYKITFITAPGDTAPTAGSFVYDAAAPTTSQFSNFKVTWANVIFDLTDSANAGGAAAGACDTDAVGTLDALDSFRFLSTHACDSVTGAIGWSGGTVGIPGQGGSAFFSFRRANAAAADRMNLIAVASPAFIAFGNGDFQMTATPEPSTFAMVIGGAALVARPRKRISSGSSQKYRYIREPWSTGKGVDDH